MDSEERMISKRKVSDGETVNARDERRIGKNIIHDTSTTTMGPTSEELRTRQA